MSLLAPEVGGKEGQGVQDSSVSARFDGWRDERWDGKDLGLGLSAAGLVLVVARVARAACECDLTLARRDDEEEGWRMTSSRDGTLKFSGLLPGTYVDTASTPDGRIGVGVDSACLLTRELMESGLRFGREPRSNSAPGSCLIRSLHDLRGRRTSERNFVRAEEGRAGGGAHRRDRGSLAGARALRHRAHGEDRDRRGRVAEARA